MWVSSIVTMVIVGAFFLPRQENINAPGEVGEVFTGAAFLVVIALVLVTGILGLLFNKRK